METGVGHFHSSAHADPVFLKKLLRSLLDRYFHSFARKSDLDNLYNQFAGLLEVRAIVGDNIPFGPLRGWALSPDALAVVLRDILQRRSPHVIEFGSGESTLAIAATLRRVGGGFLTTVEHDSEFSATVKARLLRAGLTDIVDQRLVEIQQYSEPDFPPFQSYNLEDMDQPFDVAVVDGPVVSAFGEATRLAPLRWCISRLAPGASVYLDDASRPGEQKVIQVLCSEFGLKDPDRFAAEKGLARFRSADSAATPAQL